MKSNEKRDQRVACSVPGCIRILSGYTGLHAHLKAHQNVRVPKRPPPANEIYHCTVCSKTFSHRDNLKRHLQTQHTQGDGQGVIEIYV